MRRFALCTSLLFGCTVLVGCDEPPQPPTSPTSTASIADDADLFRLVTEREPFAASAAFPRVEGIVAGSAAHQPMIRVRLNARAAGALRDGRLPAGTRFPDGSVIVKEILAGGNATAYAVMYKATADARAGNGWLWAEFTPGGNAAYSISNRGSACTGCHSLDQGLQNDLVRSFERQR